ncbi:MAG TPA: hypothetical protein VIR16_02850, partial [Candidatus Limnocylindrales bacterium]
MTTRAPFDLGHEDTPPRSGSLEARASIVLKALAAINVAGIVMATLPQPLPQSLLEALAFNLAAAALAVLEIGLARALDHRRPWAVAAVRRVLVLLIAAGIGATLVGAQAGVTRLPFEAVFAVWALLGARDGSLARHGDRRGALTVAVGVLAVASMLGHQAVFGWGGLLDGHQSDLHASLSADCGPAAAGPPAAITVTYDWSWAPTSPLPSGLDMVVVGWNRDADGRQLYYYDDAPLTDPGIYPGRRSYPSEDMASQIAESSAASWSWGVELGEEGMRPGRVELHLARATQVPTNPGPLVLTASYVHLGIWHSDAVAVTCSWSSPSWSAAPEARPRRFETTAPAAGRGRCGSPLHAGVLRVRPLQLDRGAADRLGLPAAQVADLGVVGIVV